LQLVKSDKTLQIFLASIPVLRRNGKKRFVAHGIDGLFDRLRTGRPRKYNDNTEKIILSILDKQPPQGRLRWNRFLITGELGDLTAHQVWLVVKKNKV
jgi:transposase